MSSVTSRMADDLASTILNSRDIATVREGVPAYLLMMDSFLKSSPDNPALLLAAANMNSSFSNFTDESRTRLLTDKALSYSLRAACIEQQALCGVRGLPFAEFRRVVDGRKESSVPVLYAVGVAWAGWIAAHSDDFNAIAELGKVKYLIARVIELNEEFDHGGPHLYMGGLETALPPAMGGNLDKGQMHFERALEIGNGQYLMTKVIYAEQYARLAFDQELHDRLLEEVLQADPVAEGMTLSNVFAQERARTLLADSNEYF
ncbi:MAG: TRAP transporter TatT component family protein [Pseudomonadales bacterium]